MTFSNHIGSSSELLVLADIKPGFIPIRSPVTYAGRLRRHLKLLDALRRNGLEADTTGAYVGPIDSLRTLQFISWTLIDNDTKMLLAVNFDRAFEPYIRRIVDQSGPLLDTIFCHCVGFEGRSSDQGFSKFMDFVVENQAPVELFAAAAPDLTVDDGDYFIEVNSALSSNNTGGEDPLIWLAEQTFSKPHEKQIKAARERPHDLLNQSLRILRVFHEVAPMFPASVQDGQEARDDILFYNLADKVMPGFWHMLISRLQQIVQVSADDLTQLQTKLFAKDLAGLHGTIESLSDQSKDPLLHRLISTYKEPLHWFSHPPKARATVDENQAPAPEPASGPASEPASGPAPVEVQLGLINRPGPVTHAGLVFLRVDNASSGRQFLTQMVSLLWPAEASDTRYNLSITHDGLQSLGMHDDKLARFPRAFREGMDKRAGLLGDTGNNHPSKWSWPEVAWPLTAKARAIPPWTIDIIVQITVTADYVDGDHVFNESHPVYAKVESLADTLPDGVTLLGVDPMWRKYMDTTDADGKNKKRIVGHLGFADAISQPEQHRDKPEYTTAPVDHFAGERPSTPETGDLLIGHKSSLDTDTYTMASSPLHNGTFQIIRKLRINVDGFEEAVAGARVHTAAGAEAAAGSVDPNWRDRVGAKMIGREKDGKPLSASAKGIQGFNYLDDPHGHHTPLQSHVRLSNPRESDTPRILRRGFSYGPPYKKGWDKKGRDKKSQDNNGKGTNSTVQNGESTAAEDRGLYFIAYAASISEQFEVLQRWMSGSNSTGLSSWHGDPLLSPKRPGAERHFRYVEKTEQGKQLVVVDLGDDPIAGLQWGTYAFTPSREGLQFIASDLSTTADEKPADTARHIIHRIATAEAGATAADWRMLLEDGDDKRREERRHVWKQIRKDGGVLQTDYAVLVASADAVDQVLRNTDGAFSTSAYLERMKTSLGPQYLGFDRTPEAVAAGQDHARESAIVGAYLNGVISGGDAFDFAFEQTERLLRKLPQEFEPQAYFDGRQVATGRHVALIRLVMDLVAVICREKFGLDLAQGGIQYGGPEPTPPHVPHCPGDFLSASAHIFTPYPEPRVSQIAQFSGDRMRRAAAQVVVREAPAGTLLEHLKNTAKADGDGYWSDDKIVEGLTAVSLGLAAPVYGSFLSVMFDWIDRKTLWRHQQRLQEEAPDTSELRAFAFKALYPQVLNSLSARTAPDFIMRKTTRPVELGGVSLAAGELIVASLASALDDDPERQEYFMFGGDYHEREHSDTFSHHACPGRSIGTNTILGCAMAIISAGLLDPVGPLTLRLQ